MSNASTHLVYAISSQSRNYIYVGITADLMLRLNRHNAGYERTTKPYAPFDLIYCETCADRKKARQMEKYLKSGTGKEQLKKIREALLK
jgi:putative endonuclease